MKMNLYNNNEDENIIIDFVKNTISTKTNYFLEDSKTLRSWVKEWADSKKNDYSNYGDVFLLSKILQEDKEIISDFIDFYKNKKIQKVIDNAIGKTIRINNGSKTISSIDTQTDKDKINICFQDNEVVSISSITELEKVLIANKRIYQKGVNNV